MHPHGHACKRPTSGGLLMPNFRILSGDSWIVKATDAAEAEAKYCAMLNGETCPCGVKDCDCLEEWETVTEAVPC